MKNNQPNLDLIEQHKRHIRGDRASGIGFAYECLCRCCLMLKLDPSDVIEIWEGEDALVTRKGDRKCYYQFKYSINPWTKGRFRKLLPNAERLLKKNVFSSWVLWTNASQNKPARDELDKFKIEWTGRFSYREFSFNADSPFAEIHDRIRKCLRKKFKNPDLSAVPTACELDLCCNALVALEARLKLGQENLLDGDQVWREGGLEALCNRIVSRTCGDRLKEWAWWEDEAEKHNGDPFLSAIRASVPNDGCVTLAVEDQVCAVALKWAERPRQAHVVLIHGPSGTGKTWLLARLGLRLSKELQVYCADSSSAGDYPNLEYLLELNQKRVALLIDDFVEEEWARHLPKVMSAPNPIIVIVATSAKQDDCEVLRLTRRFGAEPTRVELGHFEPDSEDLKNLIRKTRHGLVSNRERRELKLSSIRYAVRVLKGEQVQEEIVSRVSGLWDDYKPWVLPFVVCSLLRVRLPSSVLHKHIWKLDSGSSMPQEVWPLVLRKRIGETEVLWLEDTDIATGVLSILTRDGVWQEDLDALVLGMLIELIDTIDINSPVERQFARRAIRGLCRVRPTCQEVLLEKLDCVIRGLLDFEPNWALAYVWIPLLSSNRRSHVARKAIERFLYRPPSSAAEVMLLVEACEDRNVAGALLREAHNLSVVTTEPWARFIEMLSPLTPEHKRELTREFMPLLKAGFSDVQALLNTRNTALSLTTLVTVFGLPEDRLWLFDRLHFMIDKTLSRKQAKCHTLVPAYLKLADRCLMQPRHGLSIELLRTFLRIPVLNEQNIRACYDRACADYREIFDHEEGAVCYHAGALHAGLQHAEILSDIPSKANNLWTKILPFAVEWATVEGLQEVLSRLLIFLNNAILAGAVFEHVEATVLALSRCWGVSGSLSSPEFEVLLKWFFRCTRPQSRATLLVALAGAVAGTDRYGDSLAPQAKQMLASLVHNDPNEIHRSATTFCHSLARETNLDPYDPRAQVEERLLSTLEHHQIRELLGSLARATWNKRETAELSTRIFERWKNNEIVRRHLFLTLMRLEAHKEARRVLHVLLDLSRTDPDIRCLASSLESRSGNPKLARQHIEMAQCAYESESLHAMPQNISRACFDLASCHEGLERRILVLCGALSQLGRLREPGTIDY